MRSSDRGGQGLQLVPAGSVVHAVAEEGVPALAIAAAIGRGLGVPVRSVESDDAAAHFGWIGLFFAADAPASSVLTRQALDWTPTRPASSTTWTPAPTSAADRRRCGRVDRRAGFGV
jgi:hypothetical protein